MLAYLKARGCRIGGVTLGERGMVWYDEDGRGAVLPALGGAGASTSSTRTAPATSSTAPMSIPRMARPDAPWREHFRFARAASAYAIQHLGNEASLPSLADIERIQSAFPESTSRP